MFEETAVNFNHYFWTPYPFIVLIFIALFESFIAFKFLSGKTAFSRITLTFVVANVLSFFLEYYLFLFLNGGHRTLVWIPWVKIIKGYDLFMYLISFPIIFLISICSEFFIADILLNGEYKWRQVFKVTFRVNFISTLLLIIIFNVIVFNIIKGEEEGYFDDPLPEILLKRKINVQNNSFVKVGQGELYLNNKSFNQ